MTRLAFSFLPMYIFFQYIYIPFDSDLLYIFIFKSLAVVFFLAIINNIYIYIYIKGDPPQKNRTHKLFYYFNKIYKVKSWFKFCTLELLDMLVNTMVPMHRMYFISWKKLEKGRIKFMNFSQKCIGHVGEYYGPNGFRFLGSPCV